MAMNPCGFCQEESSRERERERDSTQRVIKVWREEMMFQSRTGMHLNEVYHFSGLVTMPQKVWYGYL